MDLQSLVTRISTHFIQDYKVVILQKMIRASNPNAISLLEKNQDKISWYHLSENPNAMSLLEKNQDKIDWYHLSKNPNAISFWKRIKIK
jgi:hypothetical protein